MASLQAQLDRLRFITALRFVVVSTVILVVSALAGLSTGIMSLVPPIVLVLFLKDESFTAGMMMAAGIVYGALVVFLTSYFWSHVPPAFLVIILLHLFVLGYWMGQAIRGRWPHMAFALSAELVLLSGVFTEITGAAEAIEVTMVWLIEVPVGVVLGWIILIGIWPSPTARDLKRLVKAVRPDCATLLRASITPVSEGHAATFAASRLSLKFFGDTARLINQNAARFRRPDHDPDHDHRALIAELDALTEIYANIRYIQRAFEDLPGPGLDEAVRAAAARIMATLADRLDGRPEGEPGSGLQADYRLIEQADRAYIAAGDDLTARRLAARLTGFVVAARSLERYIALIDAPDDLVGAMAPAEPTASRAPLLQADSLKAAIKLIIGVLIGLIVFMVTNLPASAYLVISILIVLVQPNIGRAHLRIRLWFPGVLIGSLWALAGLSVLSVLPHFGIYLVWLLPGLMLAGYLGTGPDRVAYMGIQLAAAMATILGMAVYPIGNVVSAEDRVLGAVVGFMIALPVYHLIWPNHPATMLRRSVAGNLRELQEALTSLCRAGGTPPGSSTEKDAERHIAAMKLQIQADFGLLYDYSYMLTKRVRPAFDYFAIAREVGLIYMQLWCLEQVLARRRDPDERRSLVEPILAVQAPLTTIYQALAASLEDGERAPAADIQASMDAAQAQLQSLSMTLAQGDTPERPLRNRMETEYGMNAVSLMLFHLARLAEATRTDGTAQPLKTAQLVHLYEAADQ